MHLWIECICGRCVPAGAKTLQGGRDIGHVQAVLAYIHKVVPWRSMAKGIANRPGGEKENAVMLSEVLLMAVSGKYGIYAILFEKADILPPFFHGEIEIVLRLIHALPYNGAMEEHKGVFAAPGAFQLLLEPGQLLFLSVLDHVLYTVGIHPYESASLVLEREAVITPPGNILLLLFPCKSKIIMV